jgi:hypothetical protein
MFFVESLRPPDVFLLEQSRIRARENFGTRAISQKISALVAQNRDRGQQHADFHDVQIARAAHHAHREQQRISRKEKAHQQPGFGEDDARQQGITQPAGEHLRQQMDQSIRIRQAAPDVQQRAEHLRALHCRRQFLQQVVIDL